MKTSELKDGILNWAVAIALRTMRWDDDRLCYVTEHGQDFEPSTDWSQGGPIIERERIELTFDRANETDTLWRSEMFDMEGVSIAHEYGPTPLIAAMRCYVASKLGDTIDIPEELNHV